MKVPPFKFFSPYIHIYIPTEHISVVEVSCVYWELVCRPTAVVQWQVYCYLGRLHTLAHIKAGALASNPVISASHYCLLFDLHDYCASVRPGYVPNRSVAHNDYTTRLEYGITEVCHKLCRQSTSLLGCVQASLCHGTLNTAHNYKIIIIICTQLPFRVRCMLSKKLTRSEFIGLSSSPCYLF